VDQADHARFAAQLPQVAAAADAIPPIAAGVHLKWRAVHAAIEAILAPLDDAIEDGLP
jgi:hypothetical protein